MCPEENSVMRLLAGQSTEVCPQCPQSRMYQLLTVTTLLSAALVSGAVPKCDQTITSQLASLHPNGIPQNIIGN
ncbi:hypothetical protein J6590_084867, partial [Homalodisca vitripennis]